jgi:lipase chaperone LimK
MRKFFDVTMACLIAFMLVCSFAGAEVYTKSADGQKLVISDTVVVVNEATPQGLKAKNEELALDIVRLQATIARKQREIARNNALTVEMKSLGVANVTAVAIEEPVEELKAEKGLVE